MENKKLEKLSPLNNIPNEIVNKWRNELSEDQLIKIANQHLLAPPALDISVSAKENINKWKVSLKGKAFGKKNIEILRKN